MALILPKYFDCVVAIGADYPTDGKKKVWIALFFIIFLCAYLTSCSNDDTINKEVNNFEINEIAFPNPPVEIANNDNWSFQLINYFNVVKVSETKYYMYFTAFENNVSYYDDFNQNIYLASSTDCVHWQYEHTLIMKNAVEMSVFVLPGDEYPFRLIANVHREKKDWTPECTRMLCMWKSKDGLNFEDRTILLNDMVHDTQNVMIVYPDYLKLFTRSWVLGRYLGLENIGVNRKISVCNFDYDGNQLTSLTMLSPDYVYNSAASLYRGREIMFPTFFNEKEGNNDSCYVKSYVNLGFYTKEISCELGKWLKEDEKWVTVAPGIISIGDKNFIFYNVHTRSHDSGATDKSRYYMIEIVIK